MKILLAGWSFRPPSGDAGSGIGTVAGPSDRRTRGIQAFTIRRDHDWAMIKVRHCPPWAWIPRGMHYRQPARIVLLPKGQNGSERPPCSSGGSLTQRCLKETVQPYSATVRLADGAPQDPSSNAGVFLHGGMVAYRVLPAPCNHCPSQAAREEREEKKKVNEQKGSNPSPFPCPAAPSLVVSTFHDSERLLPSCYRAVADGKQSINGR